MAGVMVQADALYQRGNTKVHFTAEQNERGEDLVNAGYSAVLIFIHLVTRLSI